MPSIGSPVALYVHVPFCRKKCTYCDFFSVTNADAALMGRTLEATLRELKFFMAEFGIGGFDTVYVGGGTPSCVPVSLLSRFLGGLSAAVSGSVGEFTVEANPESLSAEVLDLFAASGVTRVSVGIQTLDDGILHAMGRLGNRKTSLAALALLRDRWRGELSVDLIAGFPGQTQDILNGDIARVLDFFPRHVSLYSLTVEEGTPLDKAIRNGSIILPDQDEQDEVWLSGARTLAASGFSQYEVSNFAKPGAECRHNRHYWNLDPYIGIGPGGVSTVPGLARTRDAFVPSDGAVRIVNTSNIERFSQDRGFGMLFETIQAEDFMFEHFMMALRTRDGLDCARYRERFGVLPEDYNRPVLEKWTGRGLVESDGTRMRMTEKGLLFLNEFLVELMQA